MTERITPIYEQDPEQIKYLHNSLSTVHQAITSGMQTEEAHRHTARAGDWEITLTTSEASELQAASLVRCGQERYDFKRTGDTAWGEVGGNHLFADAHFGNLVTMAVSHGLQWATLRDIR